MDIIQEKTNELEAVIKIKLTEEDYKEKIEKGLKEMQKTAQVPGFRPGKVPMGMIKKMYGKSIKIDEINKLLVDSVYDYVKEQNMNIIGGPIPRAEEMKDIDWDNQTEFNLTYDIGFPPNVDVVLDEKIKVEYYNIKASKKIIDEQISEMQRRYGTMINPDTSEKDDVIFGEVVEMENENTEKDNGVRNKTNIYIQYLKDADTIKRFIGLKKGDTVLFEPLKATGNESETSNMLNVKKEKLHEISPLFKFVAETISRVNPSEINDEFFKKVAPDKEIKNEKEFRNFVAGEIEKQLQVDSDKHFKNDAVKKIVEKANMALPEEFMKKWLVANNKGEVTKEQVEKEFDSFADSFRWQFIENHIVKENNIEIKEDEIKEHLRSYFRMQMKQYGQDNLDDSIIEDFVNRIIEKEEELKKVYEKIMDDKLLELFKTKLKLKNIDINFEDFVKLVSEKYDKAKASK